MVAFNSCMCFFLLFVFRAPIDELLNFGGASVVLRQKITTNWSMKHEARYKDITELKHKREIHACKQSNHFILFMCCILCTVGISLCETSGMMCGTMADGNKKQPAHEKTCTQIRKTHRYLFRSIERVVLHLAFVNFQKIPSHNSQLQT